MAATFDSLEFRDKPDASRGIQAILDFDNGYSASVIKGPYTYGGDEGLYELAVLHGGSIVYDTPVTNDVEGYLTPEKVTELLQQIEALPRREHGKQV